LQNAELIAVLLIGLDKLAGADDHIIASWLAFHAAELSGSISALTHTTRAAALK